MAGALCANIGETTSSEISVHSGAKKGQYISQSEPTQAGADSEGQAQVPESEVVPRAKRRQCELSNCPRCRRTEVST
jgi:hypothetical protein